MAGIVASDQQRAVYELVRLLKNYRLWSKMKAIYPFVGGTAETHKWNLKDPRDVDAAFRLMFAGGWTHSSTGALPNGTNGRADTFFAPASHMTSASGHASVYNRSNTQGARNDYGVAGSSNIQLGLATRWVDGRVYSDFYSSTSANRISAASTDSSGFWLTTRQSTTSLKLFRNNATVATNTQTSVAVTSLTNILTIAAYRSGTNFSNYNNREIAFFSLGDGLTDDESSNLYNAVEVYQRLLGRAI